MSQLTAGYSTVDITPPLGVAMAGYGSREKPAESVADPLQAQALVLTSGEASCALVCTDLICLNTDVADEARAAAAAASGLSPTDIMVCATHTHWGPIVSGGEYMPRYLLEKVSPEYRRELVSKLAGIVAEAKTSQVAVAAGIGAGFAHGITFNRRPVGADRKTEMRLAMDPARAAVASREGNRLAESWVRGQHLGPRLSPPLSELDNLQVGPADAEVTVLRLQQLSGEPLVGLTCFACHAVCGNDDLYAISADFPGFARSTFAGLINAPMMFAAGCSGDQVPRWRGKDARRRVGASCGAEAGRVWLGIDETSADLPLRVVSRRLGLPLNRRAPSLAEAEAKLAAFDDPESTAACMARATVAFAREIAQMTEYPAEIWAMRLGDLALVALPGEILTEIGMQIKQRSPFPYTMVISCANACIGYLPTDFAIAEGGYEPAWTPVGEGTEAALVDNGLALLDELAIAE